MAKRIGRPPLDPDSESVPVSVRIPARDYDEICRQAQREGRTVAAVIRRSSRLVSYLKIDDDPQDG